LKNVTHPTPRFEFGIPFTGLDLPVLSNADPDQLSGAADAEALATPVTFHQRLQRGHERTLVRFHDMDETNLTPSNEAMLDIWAAVKRGLIPVDEELVGVMVLAVSRDSEGGLCRVAFHPTEQQPMLRRQIKRLLEGPDDLEHYLLR